MEDWEAPYMRELARTATQNGGTVHTAGVSDLRARLCRVEPPPTCPYWNSPTIVTRRIVKS
jgi:hypothetical protein